MSSKRARGKKLWNNPLKRDLKHFFVWRTFEPFDTFETFEPFAAFETFEPFAAFETLDLKHFLFIA